MQDRGFDAAIVEALIERLTTEKLLDDSRYVENFIAYHAARGQGPLRVRAELRRKGISGEIVEERLQAFPGWITELKVARRKKFGARAPEDFAGRMREARFLSYRGFTSAQIRTALGSDVDLDDLET